MVCLTMQDDMISKGNRRIITHSGGWVAAVLTTCIVITN